MSPAPRVTSLPFMAETACRCRWGPVAPESGPPGRQFIPRNAPSLLNQGLRSPYVFWDGRVSNLCGGSCAGGFDTPAKKSFPGGITNILAAQAMFPVTNRQEMRGEVGDRDVFGNPNELAQYADSQYV